ncbi:DUF624 domain-containing protein [Occultella glacieicola]|uniref:DUF624 domain-containing protein n=1 Tax=Occultella glacieicola TaxID=2518684 RepID=A0ABY2DXZ5_9MICO|nr:DUF624 domain-containing protein [Occultella glacieicola]TDE89169.1 DUF624 domain-containing protein [Occultella glacieicola]
MTTAPEAPTTVAAGRTERWYGWADAVGFVAVLNVLVLAFTVAGGVVLGFAPALAAAVAVSRARIRGESQPLLRTFASAWRGQLRRANLLQAPGWLLLLVLALNLSAFWGEPGGTALVVALTVAAGLTLTHQVLVITMDAHYDLRARDCLRLALAFALRFPGVPLLLAATTALVAAVTAWLPGLLPTVSVGVWIYLCTALCLSFFAANDRQVEAQPRTTPV